MRMIALEIPGRGELRLAHLMLDFSGTLACDGVLLPGVAERIADLAGRLQVHVVTADTRGTAREALAGLPCVVHLLPPGGEAEAKLEFVRRFGAETLAAVGNGYNDRLALREARIGIAVVGPEGASFDALAAADVVVGSIGDALDLLREPLRLKATLRC